MLPEKRKFKQTFGSLCTMPNAMTKPGSTLDFGSSVLDVSGHREPEWLALMIAWAPYEPSRIGEVALFEGDRGVWIFGRGEVDSSSSAPRANFCQQRPGSTTRQPALESPGLSREQLRIRVERQSLHIERLGRCALEVRGERVDKCVLRPNDTLMLKGQMVLYCTRRPRKLPPSNSASLENVKEFGMPDIHGIVGESPVAWQLREQLAWLATADEHTLILGESGAGKELCAHAVHTMSGRNRGPFVARNAATIPTGLVDAELFGNIKNYPNPGMVERAGLIGSAHEGTLFLDEIGELPQSLQANLLRVLDERGEYHPLGGATTKRSHFRLIGATNRNPDVLKHDLAARLVLRLDVPTLNERREDIPLLVRHLLLRLATKNPNALRRFVDPSGPAEPRIKANLIEFLLRHHYSTNIRELEALLWRAMSASRGDAIEWLGDDTKKQTLTAEENTESPGTEDTSKTPEPTENEIRAALLEHDKNVAKAAKALGLSSRFVLYRLMRKYRIEMQEETS